MSNIIEPKILKGFRDFLPQSEQKRKDLQRALEFTFERLGFVPIDTPVLEYQEVLLGKGGGETDKQVYAFSDHGGRDVAMRFDLTVPFARFVAAHRAELNMPFKRYHIAKVWRGEKNQRGRYREFVQCDFDIVGIDNAASDFEILNTMDTSFSAIGVGGVSFQLSHRGIFNAFLEKEGLSGHSVQILRHVDKLPKIGRDEVCALLSQVAGDQKAVKILDFITRESDFKSTIDKLAGFVGKENEAVARMRSIFQMADACGFVDKVNLNPAITRGLDYYTGVVFETFLDNAPEIGSVCSGGRYNDLAGLYTKEHLPGVGCSIGLDRLIAGLEEISDDQKIVPPVSVLILNLGNDLLSRYFTVCRKLIDAGIPAEVYLLNKKLKNQFTYAEKQGIPFAIIIGEEEAEKNQLSIKDLNSRESFDDLTVESGLDLLKSRLSENRSQKTEREINR